MGKDRGAIIPLTHWVINDLMKGRFKMNSLQIDILIIVSGYVVAFMIYLVNKDLGFKIRNTLNYIVIAFIVYLMICSIY